LKCKRAAVAFAAAAFLRERALLGTRSFKLQFVELSPKTHVIANQRARWCGDPLQICGFFPKIDGDCHAIVRNGSQ